MASAQYDIAGRSMPDYVFIMVVPELTRVVAAQRGRIEDLEARFLRGQAEEVIEKE